MVYDIANAKIGDKIYGMMFEGLVEEYEVCASTNGNSEFNIKGNSIEAALNNNHEWFTAYEEALDYCAIYQANIFNSYRKSIEDIEDLLRFMYRNFVADNKPRNKPFRERVARDVIREKAMYFGIDLGTL